MYAQRRWGRSRPAPGAPAYLAGPRAPQYGRLAWLGQDTTWPWDPGGLSPMGPPAAPITGPDILPWDPSMTTATGRVPAQNNGCPEGYFAQFVGLGEPGSTPVAGKSYALRCRLMSTSTAQTIQAESGPTASEALGIYTGALADTARQAGAVVSSAFAWTPWVIGGMLVVGGLMAVAFLPRLYGRR